MSPALAGGFLTTAPPGKSLFLNAVQIWPMENSSSWLLSSFDMIQSNMERRKTMKNSGIIFGGISMKSQECVSVCVCVCVNIHIGKEKDMHMSVFMFVCYIKDQPSLTAPLLFGMTTCSMLPLYISCPDLDSAISSRSPRVSFSGKWQ